MRRPTLAVALLIVSLSTTVLAQKYVVTGRIPLAGDEGWDYLIVDNSNHNLYVTHGDQVHVVDLTTEKQTATITGLKHIHGVALADDLGKGFVSDGGDNVVVVFDLKSNQVSEKVKAGENPDGLIYDPSTKRVFAFNGKSNDATVIDAQTNKVVGTIPLSGKPEFPAVDGKGNLFVNIESKSSVASIDPANMKVKKEWSISPCEEPSGLAFDTVGRRLFSVCSNKKMAVSDADAGKVVTMVTIGEDPDAAAYDSAAKLVFSSNAEGTLSVVKQDSPDKYSEAQTLTTEKRARTMALDSKTHKIYLSSAEFGPAPKPTPDNPHGRPKPKPGSFRLVVVSPEK